MNVEEGGEGGRYGDLKGGYAPELEDGYTEDDTV